MCNGTNINDLKNILAVIMEDMGEAMEMAEVVDIIEQVVVTVRKCPNLHVIKVLLVTTDDMM